MHYWELISSAKDELIGPEEICAADGQGDFNQNKDSPGLLASISGS